MNLDNSLKQMPQHVPCEFEYGEAFQIPGNFLILSHDS